MEPIPSLEGRKAQCAYGCHAEVDSEWNLAFFQYRGPESAYAKQTCGNCGFYEIAHKEKRFKCENFTPYGPFEVDLYYCGCFGWE